MKNKQKGSTTSLLVLVVLVLMVCGFYYWKIKNTEGPAVQNQQQTETQNTPAISSYSDPFNFSFSYPKTWKLVTGLKSTYYPPGASGAINLQNVDSYNDTIVINKVSASKVTTESGKFGNVSYWFDQTKNQWMTSGLPNERDGQIIKEGVATPIFYTNSGLPVFRGTSSWKTDIVALAHDRFLVVNIYTSGFTDPLDPFVKTISVGK